MPVSRGSWQGVLLGPPRTEYICPYGHGTLRVKDLHLESPEATNWRQIDDIWKELERMEETPSTTAIRPAFVAHALLVSTLSPSPPYGADDGRSGCRISPQII